MRKNQPAGARKVRQFRDRALSRPSIRNRLSL